MNRISREKIREIVESVPIRIVVGDDPTCPVCQCFNGAVRVSDKHGTFLCSCCDTTGDVLTYIRKRDDVSFMVALATLSEISMSLVGGQANA